MYTESPVVKSVLVRPPILTLGMGCRYTVCYTVCKVMILSIVRPLNLYC
jgi:hypothetical protein